MPDCHCCAVVYHPRLERSLFTDTRLPAVNQMVMFALHNSPRFGKIVEVNPLSPKPLSVMLWKPNGKAKSLLSARFKSTQSLESGPEIVQIAPAQIKTHVIFSAEGLLVKKSQDKVRRLITRCQRQPHSKRATSSKALNHSPASSNSQEGTNSTAKPTAHHTFRLARF